jgi:hypothetical protein
MLAGAGKETPETFRRPFTGRAGRAMAAVLLAAHLAGCYRYVPVTSTDVPVGTQVSVGINDSGRVALQEPVGPGVRRLDGAVLAKTDTTLVLGVNGVEYFDLPTRVRWDGERVLLSRSFINEVRERRLSKSRTWLTIAGVVVGGILVSTLAISGFGTDDDGNNKLPPGPGEPQ